MVIIILVPCLGPSACLSNAFGMETALSHTASREVLTTALGLEGMLAPQEKEEMGSTSLSCCSRVSGDGL